MQLSSSSAPCPGAQDLWNLMIIKESIHQSDILRTHPCGSWTIQEQPNPAFPVLLHKSSRTESSKQLPASSQDSGSGFNQTELILNTPTAFLLLES
ncbi:hypothetical protein EGK_16994 [Macaca mulatta]|uniref:Uncharacterized protein n=2 Tax=Macaca TaxID=9539 RepID=G7MVF0_MACMU|nr:hypothetical protein EGK_16994 [Macaca mulatta]EHH54639.1 hypothetical protein EGM_15518 [Macaca fascicularis]